jgi:hypothetical protein
MQTIGITNQGITLLSVQPNCTIVYKGEPIGINVLVENKGWEAESFNVSVYYNNTLIDVLPVLNLEPGTTTNVDFIWKTSNIESGLYQISAYAEPVFGETDLFDNTLINGFVEIRTPEHDISVLSIEPSKTTLNSGETVEITVKITNKGHYEESFNVIVYYDLNVATATLVASLQPDETRILTLQWNTQGISEGNYTLSVLAGPVQAEKDVTDNSLEDGIIWIKAALPILLLPWWLWWVLLFLIILLTISILIILYRRRKQKKDEETFYSGWTAWYYCHDLR